MDQRKYEVMFIVRPDVSDEDREKLIAGFEATVTQGGGTVIARDETMGRRRLQYTVRKFNDGYYVILHINSGGALVAELERRLRVTEPVIKFITVRMDEEEKRLAKVKAIRDSRKKLSAQPVAAPVASVPAPEAEVEAAPVEVEAAAV